MKSSNSKPTHARAQAIIDKLGALSSQTQHHDQTERVALIPAKNDEEEPTNEKAMRETKAPLSTNVRSHRVIGIARRKKMEQARRLKLLSDSSSNPSGKPQALC